MYIYIYLYGSALLVSYKFRLEQNSYGAKQMTCNQPAKQPACQPNS